MNESDGKLLLGLDEVSRTTGVPVATLRDWRLRGIGPKSARIGRRVAYRPEDVRAWIDAQFEQAS